VAVTADPALWVTSCELRLHGGRYELSERIDEGPRGKKKGVLSVGTAIRTYSSLSQNLDVLRRSGSDATSIRPLHRRQIKASEENVDHDSHLLTNRGTYLAHPEHHI
jgi:hypothetical protein